MTKNRNNDEEALAIFAKVPLVVAKNNGFIIAQFYEGNRVIGIYKNASHFTSSQLSPDSLPSKGTLDLADVQGITHSYDIYTIISLD